MLVLRVLQEVYCAKLPSQSTVHYATPVFDVDLTHPLQMPQVSGEPSLVRVVVQSFSASWVVLELRRTCWIEECDCHLNKQKTSSEKKKITTTIKKTRGNVITQPQSHP